jgi:predicted MFS family arabinose efflux permease
VAQTPIGALVDVSKRKRSLVALSMLAIALSYGLILGSMLPVVLVAQTAIGVATVTVTPALNAISLGLVGYDQLEKRIGRNEVFNRAGNALTAVIAAGLSLFLGRQWTFGLLILLCLISIFAVYQIRDRDIDQTLARADDGGDGDENRSSWRDLVRDQRFIRFGIAVILFYFASAALLPLISQQFAGGDAERSTLFVSGCVIVAQLTMIPFAGWAGKSVNQWGRKPLSLLAFAAVALRAGLYALNQHPWLIVSLQVLDGIASGLFTILVVVIVADLTQGTGRFNLAQGAINTAIGVGAAASNLAFGMLANTLGYPVSFGVAGAIAAIGLLWNWMAIPETKPAEKGAKP